MNEQDEIEVGLRAGYGFQATWDDVILKLYCFIHECFEHLGWMQCYECRHHYLNEQELVDKYNEDGAKVNKAWNHISLDQIYFCPECLHDF